MIAALLSTIILTNASIETLLEHQLGTPEGRTVFLTESLTPYVAKADQLNQEIIALSEQVTQKMNLMNEMLPTLNMALYVNADFDQIDEILNSAQLTAEQQEIADRIANLCASIDRQ